MGCRNAPVRLDILFLSHHSQTYISPTVLFDRLSVCLLLNATSNKPVTLPGFARLIRSEYDFVESGFLVSGPSHNVLVITGDVAAQD